MGSDSQNIYSSAAHCLTAIISQTIPEKFLLRPNKEYEITLEVYETVDETITFISEFIENELLTIKFQHATGEILKFVSVAIEKLRSRANPDF